MHRGKTIIIVIALLLASLVIVVLVNNYSTNPGNDERPFYFGVTFCGESVAEAKALIDRVKNFTNLFVLLSGPLWGDTEAMYEIGDYAVANNLSYIVSSETEGFIGYDVSDEYRKWVGSWIDYREWIESWVDTVRNRWGDKFLGLYYGDEEGGKLIDTHLSIFPGFGFNVSLSKGFGVVVTYENGTKMSFRNDGTIEIYVPEYSPEPERGTLFVTFPNSTGIQIKNVTDLTEEEKSSYPEGTRFLWLSDGPVLLHETASYYYENGDIKVVENPGNLVVTAEDGSQLRNQYPMYGSVWNKNPIRTFDDIADLFVDSESYNYEWLKTKNITLLTSDYALYWWDYLRGFDFVLAQLGWNNTVAQEIGLVRGAASMQNKSWGTIITWTYRDEPYLASGGTIYEQMRISYECGADYVVLFNYAPEMDGEYGILQDEHLQAMEQFWTDVVQDPEIVHGGIGAEAVLVLPEDYGWGMRNPNEKVWGIWGPDEKSEQIWNILQDTLEQYGTQLDMVYTDTEFPVTGKYSKIVYWNQTD